jgi:hypothetical protein
MAFTTISFSIDIFFDPTHYLVIYLPRFRPQSAEREICISVKGIVLGSLVDLWMRTQVAREEPINPRLSATGLVTRHYIRLHAINGIHRYALESAYISRTTVKYLLGLLPRNNIARYGDRCQRGFSSGMLDSFDIFIPAVPTRAASYVRLAEMS